MADEDIRMLLQAILDYFGWLRAVEVPKDNRLNKRYAPILIDFVIFCIHKAVAWKEMFTFDTFRAFRNYTRLKETSHAIITLSGYLQERGRIAQPLVIPNYQVQLPETYEQYLLYRQQSKGVSNLRTSRRVLVSLHTYLENHQIGLSAMKIEHLDGFLAELNKPLSTNSRKTYLYHLRAFLKYLYEQRRVLRKDLAPLLKGPPIFSLAKPPKFLRPQEVQKLFQTLTLDTPSAIRTYAMAHLAYTLGLRPAEISKITLDDIAFQTRELTVPMRKTDNPGILPIPEKTLKAIATYVLKVRPKTEFRELFLTLHTPYRPVSSAVVIHHISRAMKTAGLPSSAYWLRHTYAQNLLHIGRSIHEIKELLGHHNIQSTQRYLHIHTELMRKVLFDETL